MKSTNPNEAKLNTLTRSLKNLTALELVNLLESELSKEDLPKRVGVSSNTNKIVRIQEQQIILLLLIKRLLQENPPHEIEK